MKRELLVKEMGTDKVIHRVDVSGKSDRQVEKVEMGMLRQMDLDRFYIVDTKEKS